MNPRQTVAEAAPVHPGRPPPRVLNGVPSYIDWQIRVVEGEGEGDLTADERTAAGTHPAANRPSWTRRRAPNGSAG
ncbi:hypothetical protein [Streptomyces sp. NPDC048428]|uniref:hypothetical protein n=1 Tax=Streptomyces sp. NPDC048428 TaxID=3154503 RepID=UPI0034451E44